MVDAAFDKALRVTMRLHEIGGESPYQLSFAAKGKSGASFGFMQGDLAAGQATVTRTFEQVLAANEFTSAEISSFTRQLAVPLISCPLSTSDRNRINLALVESATLVDSMDGDILSDVYTQLDVCSTAAAANNGITILPKARLYMAMWINMTGPPTSLRTWLGGGIPASLRRPVPPAANPVDGPAMETYLQATDFFVENPHNFPSIMQCAAAGMAALQAGP